MQRIDILTTIPPPADKRLSYGPDPNQFGDLRLPATRGPHPVIMNIHGGFWRMKYDLAHAGHLCAALKKSGIATWNLEYRRVGNPGGGWPATFEDIKSGYHFLLQIAEPYGLDTNRLLLMGHSAGGQLALCLAGHEHKIDRAVSLAGVVDLRRAWELKLSHDAVGEFMSGSPQQVPEHYREASPANLTIAAQQLLVHGTEDDTVPLEISKSYVQSKQANGEKVELLSLAKAGHFDLIDPSSQVWAVIEKRILLMAHLIRLAATSA